MGVEGTKGGETRPASRPEIAKLPRRVCVRCRLAAPAPIINADSRCSNEAACSRRAKKVETGATR